MKHRILKAIIAELREQADTGFRTYIGYESPDSVDLIGKFNLEKLAERVRDVVMENS